MQPGLLPLFPLHVVLLPGGELPLHIFEDRYKEMMREVIRDRLEFGVVLAGDKGIVSTGCSATVDEVLRRYPDGRLDIMTRGRRRFEIVRLNDDKPYLQASIDFFDDDASGAASPEIRQRAIDGYNELRALSEGGPAPALRFEDPQLSFALAQQVPDLNFRQVLLSTRSEALRLTQLAEFLPAYLHRLRRVQHVKEVAPKNGHGMSGHGMTGHGIKERGE